MSNEKKSDVLDASNHEPEALPEDQTEEVSAPGQDLPPNTSPESSTTDQDTTNIVPPETAQEQNRIEPGPSEEQAEGELPPEENEGEPQQSDDDIETPRDDSDEAPEPIDKEQPDSDNLETPEEEELAEDAPGAEDNDTNEAQPNEDEAETPADDSDEAPEPIDEEQPVDDGQEILKEETQAEETTDNVLPSEEEGQNEETTEDDTPPEEDEDEDLPTDDETGSQGDDSEQELDQADDELPDDSDLETPDEEELEEDAPGTEDNEANEALPNEDEVETQEENSEQEPEQVDDELPDGVNLETPEEEEPAENAPGTKNNDTNEAQPNEGEDETPEDDSEQTPEQIDDELPDGVNLEIFEKEHPKDEHDESQSESPDTTPKEKSRREKIIQFAKWGGIVGIPLLTVVLLFIFKPALITSLFLKSELPLHTPETAAIQWTAEELEMINIVGQTLTETEKIWSTIFTEKGGLYRKPDFTIYTNKIDAVCVRKTEEGQIINEAFMGSFYCPEERRIYIDLALQRDLKNRLDIPGDFAQAYVAAHEIGHHVQNLAGISEQIPTARLQLNDKEFEKVIQRMELQADCFAGIWAKHTAKEEYNVSPDEFTDTLNGVTQYAEAHFKDRASGVVMPDQFSHAPLRIRLRWFTIGFTKGTFDACDTFTTQEL